jgi:hypothetical protein
LVNASWLQSDTTEIPFIKIIIIIVEQNPIQTTENIGGEASWLQSDTSHNRDFPSSRVIVILVEQNPIQTTLVMP